MFHLIFVGIFVCLCAYQIQTFLRGLRLPSGPNGLPLVGYLPFLGKKHHLKLSKIAKKYGNVFSLRLGVEDVVFLHDWKSIQDAYSNPLLLGRPQNVFGGFFEMEGVATTEGEEWKEQRRISLRIFHDLGFSRQTMEDNVKDELKFFLEELENNCGKPFNMGQLLSASASNNIAYFLFGHRYDYKDPVRTQLNEAFSQFSDETPMLSPIVFFPFLVKLVFKLKLPMVKEALKTVGFVSDVVNEEIRQHKEDTNRGVRDFIDGCLAELENPSGILKCLKMSDTFILVNVMDFFGAGSDTVMVTLKWLLLVAAAKPEMQKQIQDEISDVVGDERWPSYADRARMPFTQAFICETQRWRPVLPLNLPRRAMKDTEIAGHFIPKDTQVIGNLWALTRDEAVWTNPETFDPSRFLSEDGKQFRKSEALIPFGYGKRSCLGESLARLEVFLYFTHILQRYSISLPEGTKPDFEGILGLTLKPKLPSEFIFERRR